MSHYYSNLDFWYFWFSPIAIPNPHRAQQPACCTPSGGSCCWTAHRRAEKAHFRSGSCGWRRSARVQGLRWPRHFQGTLGDRLALLSWVSLQGLLFWYSGISVTLEEQWQLGKCERRRVRRPRQLGVGIPAVNAMVLATQWLEVRMEDQNMFD